MKSKYLLTIALLLVSFGALSQKHVHGLGQLLIVQEVNQWQFEFILPAVDILGFEHSSETDAQKRKVNATIEKIEQIDSMLDLPKHCALVSSQHSLYDNSHDNSDKHLHEHSHSDISITYIVNCQAQINSLSIVLFLWSKSLEKLNTQWITNAQQGARELTPESNILKF